MAVAHTHTHTHLFIKKNLIVFCFFFITAKSKIRFFYVISSSNCYKWVFNVILIIRTFIGVGEGGGIKKVNSLFFFIGGHTQTLWPSQTRGALSFPLHSFVPKADSFFFFFFCLSHRHF